VTQSLSHKPGNHANKTVMPLTNKALPYTWITDNDDKTGDSLSHANTAGNYRPVRWTTDEDLKIGHERFRSQCLMFVFQTPLYVNP